MFELSAAPECDIADVDQVVDAEAPLESRLAVSPVALTMVNASSSMMNKCLTALDACVKPHGMHAVEIFFMSWDQFLHSCSAIPPGLVQMYFDGQQHPADRPLLDLKLKQLRKLPYTACVPVIASGQTACKLPREVLKNTSVLLEERGDDSDFESIVAAYLLPFTQVVAEAA